MPCCEPPAAPAHFPPRCEGATEQTLPRKRKLVDDWRTNPQDSRQRRLVKRAKEREEQVWRGWNDDHLDFNEEPRPKLRRSNAFEQWPCDMPPSFPPPVKPGAALTMEQLQWYSSWLQTMQASIDVLGERIMWQERILEIQKSLKELKATQDKVCTTVQNNLGKLFIEGPMPARG